MPESFTDPMVYTEEWAVCGRLDQPVTDYMKDPNNPWKWNRGLLVRAGGVGRLWLRAIPDPQGRLDGSTPPEVSAHTRAKLAAAAPCMFRLLMDIYENPDKDWSQEITNVTRRALAGQGYYYYRWKEPRDLTE